MMEITAKRYDHKNIFVVDFWVTDLQYLSADKTEVKDQSISILEII